MSRRKLTATIVGLVTAAIGGSVAGNQVHPEPANATPPPCSTGPLPDSKVGSLEMAPTTWPPQRYAPLVFLHPREKFRPMRADCFADHSSLDFAEGPGQDTEVVAVGDLKADELVNPGRDSHGFTTRDLTRPFEKGRKPELEGRRGFYIDVEDSLRTGAPAADASAFFKDIPVYYEYEPRKYVTYWFFYGYSAPAALLVAPLRKPGIAEIGHEGDWEGIRVDLNGQNQATGAAYFAHGEKGGSVPWPQVRTQEGHPVVFSALGSHGSFRTSGTKLGTFDRTGAGSIWPTWQLVANARAQPWYGYGGAWGIARVVPPRWRRAAAHIGIKVGEGEFTGPLGPGYKQSAKATGTSPVG